MSWIVSTKKNYICHNPVDDDVIFDSQHIFIGTIGELNNIISLYGCPYFYKEFPYNNFAQTSLDDIGKGEAEVKTIEEARWVSILNTVCVNRLNTYGYSQNRVFLKKSGKEIESPTGFF